MNLDQTFGVLVFFLILFVVNQLFVVKKIAKISNNLENDGLILIYNAIVFPVSPFQSNWCMKIVNNIC